MGYQDLFGIKRYSLKAVNLEQAKGYSREIKDTLNLSPFR